jgi:hypothetical protein
VPGGAENGSRTAGQMLDATALVHEAYRGWLAPNNRIKQWDSLVLCQLLCADMDQVAVFPFYRT